MTTAPKSEYLCDHSTQIKIRSPSVLHSLLDACTCHAMLHGSLQAQHRKHAPTPSTPSLPPGRGTPWIPEALVQHVGMAAGERRTSCDKVRRVRRPHPPAQDVAVQQPAAGLPLPAGGPQPHQGRHLPAASPQPGIRNHSGGLHPHPQVQLLAGRAAAVFRQERLLAAVALPPVGVLEALQGTPPPSPPLPLSPCISPSSQPFTPPPFQAWQYPVLFGTDR